MQLVPRYAADLAEIANAPPPVELANDGDEEAAAASEAGLRTSRVQS
jgi:hypothetical protein